MNVDDTEREMKKKKKRKEGRRHTSNSGLSSNIGWVVDVSSLCLGYKRKENRRQG